MIILAVFFDLMLCYSSVKLKEEKGILQKAISEFEKKQSMNQSSHESITGSMK
jgi:hypothetical protein